LYIGGDGVAAGYLNRPELTAQAFINRSFVGVQGAVFQKSPLPAGGRLYRTGDLARWLPDGDIYFLGRVDHQVKIRGFRIETGEIETLLSAYEGVKETVVCARERGGEDYLCAYIVPANKPDEADDPPIAVSGLRDYLSRRLPVYMIPSYFVYLDVLPLTPNGKIDRRALPSPELHAGDNYTAPRNTMEEKLAAIWSRVLTDGPGDADDGRIGIDANYFELGGNSLSATLLLSEIHRAFQVRISMIDLFKAPTIRGVARCIAAAGKTSYSTVEAAEKRDYYPLTPVQYRLHLLQQVDETAVSYNIPSVVELEGRIDIRTLENAFERLILRHDSLRTSFLLIEGEPVQQVHDDVPFKIEYSDIAPARVEVEVKAFVRPFDLAKAPLLRVGLMKVAPEKHVLIVDIHHIISDGISFITLMREFGVLYGGGSLPGLSLQYKDYAYWILREAQKEMVEQQKSYWMEQFSGDIPVLRLPLDFPRSGALRLIGRVETFEMDAVETRRLKKLASERETTLYMVLLAVYYVLLSRLGSQEDIVVGTVAAGRRHPDFQSMVGMFVNTLALRNFPRGEKTFSVFLDELTLRTLEAFENQEYPFERLVADAGVQREPGRNPLFDVMFELQNAHVSDIEPAGVTLKPYERETTAVKFDLTLMAMETGEELSFRFLYNSALFKEDTIRRFVRYFRTITTAVLEDPDRKIADIDILSHESKEQVMALVGGDLEEEFE
jgi:tyrocidine synthetase-3